MLFLILYLTYINIKLQCLYHIQFIFMCFKITALRVKILKWISLLFCHQAHTKTIHQLNTQKLPSTSSFFLNESFIFNYSFIKMINRSQFIRSYSPTVQRSNNSCANLAKPISCYFFVENVNKFELRLFLVMQMCNKRECVYVPLRIEVRKRKCE